MTILLIYLTTSVALAALLLAGKAMGYRIK